jgi:ribosomal protein S18 acetylase RimI-like enzyme
MKYKVKPLGFLDYRTAKEIFLDVFDYSEFSDFALAWKTRIRDESLGMYTHYNELVGFALVDYQRKLNFIAICPYYQKYKLGTQLLHSVLRNCIAKHSSLILVPVPSDHVIAWYKKNGFYETNTYITCMGNRWMNLSFHTYNTRRQAPFLLSLTSK